jgi:hypothetical protein
MIPQGILRNTSSSSSSFSPSSVDGGAGAGAGADDDEMEFQVKELRSSIESLSQQKKKQKGLWDSQQV